MQQNYPEPLHTCIIIKSYNDMFIDGWNISYSQINFLPGFWTNGSLKRINEISRNLTVPLI